MSEHRNRITSVDGLERAKRRDADLDTTVGERPLNDWLEDWAHTGAIATTEVLTGLTLKGTRSQVILIACICPIDIDELRYVFSMAVTQLTRAGFVTLAADLLPSKTPNPAPTSNTGLSDTNPQPKAGRGSGNLAEQIERDFDGALD